MVSCQIKSCCSEIHMLILVNIHYVIDVNKPKATELYDILQLNPDATEAEIKSNYKKLALEHHPDKNNGVETEEVLHQI